jgi:putative DNA methylase
VHYEVRYGKNNVPEGTVNRSGARCICCGANVPFDYIREESRTGRMGARLIAVVAESDGGRNYVSPILEHEKIADIDEPLDEITEQVEEIELNDESDNNK